MKNKIDNKNEFKSEFDPLGSYTGTPFIPSFEESALAEMEVPRQDSDDL